MFLSNRLLKGFPLVFSPELGRSWTTWGDRRDWRSSITITRACAGCTSLSPGILLGRRCRHHLQRFLGILGRLWGGPRGAGVTFSPTENLIVPRALTISTPGTYWLRTAHCYHFMSLCISFQVLNQITLILFEHCFTLFNITWQPVTFSLHNGHCLEYCNIYIFTALSTGCVLVRFMLHQVTVIAKQTFSTAAASHWNYLTGETQVDIYYHVITRNAMFLSVSLALTAIVLQ